MPAPPNQTKGTALVIGSLPYTITMDVADQTSALQMWWTYTALANDRVIGITPFADIAQNYAPTIRVFTSDGTTVYKGISAAKQRSVSVPVTESEQYYFRIIQGDAGTPLNSSLVFSVVRAPQDTAPEGALISCQDEAARFKAPIISMAASNGVYQFIDDFAFMEAAIGTTLDNGTMCGDDQGTTLQVWTQNPLVQVFDGLPSYFAYTPDNISSNGTNLFYLSYAQAPGNPNILRTFTALGAETATTWTLPANSEGSRGLAVNRAGTILYYGSKAASGSAVHAYDLVGHAALSDLAATLGAGWAVHPEMFVLTDGTIMVGYGHVSATVNYKVIHYSAAGAVLHTYDLGANTIHFLGAGTDDTNFFVRVFDASVSNNRSIYSVLKTSDGTTLHTATYDHFDVGIDQIAYDPTYPLNDGPSFGVASTCTCFVVRAAIGPIPVPVPSLTYRTDPIRRLRRAPHLADATNQNRLFFPGFQLLFEAGAPRDVDMPMYFDLRWSNDGGHTWSNMHRIEAGKRGQYGYRAIWRRLGYGRDRVFEVSESNEAKVVLLDAILDPDPESGTS